MASRFRPVRLLLDGGLNLDENPLYVGDNELIVADNVWYSGNRIGTRPGAQREASGEDYDAQISGRPPIQGGVEFRKGNDSTRYHVVVAGGNIYTDDSTTVTKSGITVASGASRYWVFAQHSGTLYAAGGSGTDTPWVWTGTGNATLLTINNLSGAALSPTYIFQKWNRLFAAGFRVTSTGNLATDLSSNPMIVRFSALNQPTQWPTGNTFGGTSAIGAFSAYGDEYITGFGEYTDNEGDWLLVGTNKRIYEVQEAPDVHTPFYVSRRGIIQNGFVHQRAFVNLGVDAGDAVYLSEHGIHSVRQSQQYGGREDKFLSWKIRPLFRTINRSRIGQACGAYLREEGVVVFAVPTGSSTVNDTLLVLHVKGQEKNLSAETARWTVWRIAGSSPSVRCANALWSARSDDDEWRIYGGNIAGDVFYFDEDTTDDLGTPYQARFQTKHFDFGGPEMMKVLGDTYVHTQPSGNYTPVLRPLFDYGQRGGRPHQVRLAKSQGAEWDTAIWAVSEWATVAAVGRTKLYTAGEFNAISWQMTHAGADEPFYCLAIAFDVAGLGEDLGDVEAA